MQDLKFVVKVKHFQREETFFVLGYEQFEPMDMVLMHRPDKRWCLGYVIDTYVIKKQDEKIGEFDFEIVGKIDKTKYNEAIKTRTKQSSDLKSIQKIFKKNLCTDDEIARLLEDEIIVPMS